jgi:hypothetical protein
MITEYDAERVWVHGFYEKSQLTADAPENVADAVRLAANDVGHRQRHIVGKIARQISLMRRLMLPRLAQMDSNLGAAALAFSAEQIDVRHCLTLSFPMPQKAASQEI